MARLPSVADLGQSPTPSPQRGIYGYRAGQELDVQMQAAKSIGDTAEQIGKVAESVQQNIDKLDYARARSAFLRAKVEADNAFDGDQDYSTFEKRYRDMLGKKRDEIINGIGNPMVREKFKAESNLDFDKGSFAIRDKARAVGKDINRAHLVGELDSNVKAALQADTDTGIGLLNESLQQILGARDKGYLTAQEAEKLRQETASNYATQRVQMLPWDKQVEVLKAGMTEKEGSLPVFAKTGSEVDFISPEKRVELLRAAEQKDKARLAIATADQITGPLAGGSMNISGWMAKAQQIGDPVLREAVETRLTTEYNRRNALKYEGERSARDQVWNILDKQKSLDAVPPALLDRLPAQERIQIRDYASKLGNVPFNESADKDLTTVWLDGKLQDFDIKSIRGQLSAAQYEKWAGRIGVLNSKDAKDEEKRNRLENLQWNSKQAISMFKTTIESAGLDPSPKPGSSAAQEMDKFQSELVRRLEESKLDKGGKASETELKSIVDGLLLEGKVRGGILWDSSKRAYQLTPEERDKFYVPIGKIPASEKALIVDALTKAKQPVTNERVEELFARRRMKGAQSVR